MSLLIGVVVGGLHLWRCTIIEERFEKRYDEAEGYWKDQRDKCIKKIDELESKLKVSTEGWQLMVRACEKAAAMRSESNGGNDAK
jgi:hypothetical protein